MTRKAKRVRVVYVDPREMHAPGRCLRCDGIYRRRAGWPQAPRVLDEDEVAALVLLPGGVLLPHRRPTEDEPVRR